MTKYLTLLRILLLPQLDFRRIKKQKESSKRKSSKGGIIALLIIGGISLASVAVSIVSVMFMMGRGCDAKDVETVLTLLILVCQGIVLLFGVPMVISNIFAAKDGEKLLCLPVNSATLFAAKLTVVYVGEVITSAVMLLLTVLPFGIGASLGAAFYLTFLIAVVVLPVMPLVLACLLAFPLTYILRKIGNNTILKTVIQMLLFIGIMALYFVFIFSLTNSATVEGDETGMIDFAKLIESMAQSIAPIVKYIYPVSLLAQALSASTAGGYFLGLGGSIGANAVLFGLVLLIAIPTYKQTLSGQLETGGFKRQRVDVEIKAKGVLQQLIICDFKRVIRDNQLGFQVLMGIIVMPLLAVIFGVMLNMDEFGEFIDFNSPLYQIIASVAIFGFFLMMSGSTNFLGIYPISRERQSVFMLKTLPVSVEKILFAKILMAAGIMLIGNIISVVCMVIFMHLAWYFAILVLIALSLYQFGTMCITTYFDIRSPILDWTNFNTSLKNAKNSFMGMLVGGLLMLAIAAVAVTLIMLYVNTGSMVYAIIMWVVLLAAGVGYALLTFKITTRKGKIAFSELE